MPIYRRNLPHIERDDASYFVSFSTRYGLILSEDARTLVFNHCLFENGRKVELHAVVVMPDHVHLLFTPLKNEKEQPYTLAEIMHGIKGASAHSVNSLIGRLGPLWQPESFDRIPRTDAGFNLKKMYIIGNPIAAGLAREPHEYKWCWYE